MDTIGPMISEKDAEQIASQTLALGTRDSSGVLLQEHCRRAAVLSRKHPQIGESVLFDPISIDEGNLAEWVQLRTRLETVTKRLESWACRYLLQNAVIWSEMLKHGRQHAQESPAVYVPIIKLLVRGEFFYIRGRDAEFLSYTIPLKNWQRLADRDPLDISDEALDRIDAGYNP